MLLVSYWPFAYHSETEGQKYMFCWIELFKINNILFLALKVFWKEGRAVCWWWVGLGMGNRLMRTGVLILIYNLNTMVVLRKKIDSHLPSVPCSFPWFVTYFMKYEVHANTEVGIYIFMKRKRQADYLRNLSSHQTFGVNKHNRVWCFIRKRIVICLLTYNLSC